MANDVNARSWFCVFNNPEKHGFFGSPEEIVIQYLTNIDPNYLSKKLSISKYVKVTCTVLISVILIAFLIWNIVLYNARQEFINALPANEDTTITIIE